MLKQVLLKLTFVLEVLFLLAAAQLVQRWLGNIDMAALKQGRHLPIKESQQQGADMRAIDVRIRHDDHAVIT